MHGDGKNLFGELLADDVIVEVGLDLRRLQGNRRLLLFPLLAAILVEDNLVAQINTLVADIDIRPGNQLFHLFLVLATKGAPAFGSVTVLFVHRYSTLISAGLRPQLRFSDPRQSRRGEVPC
jgi:hypothetical protein